MWYNEGTILQKYKSKAKDKRSKRIGWEISQNEFLEVFRRNGGLCDYTNDYMVLTNGEPNSVTIERIDATKPYEFGNICLVRQDANILKNNYLDCGQTHKTLPADKREKIETFSRVCEVIFNPEKLEQLKTKYSAVQEKIAPEENVMEVVEQKTIETKTPVKNKVSVEHKTVNGYEYGDALSSSVEDLTLSKCYYEFGTQLKSLGAEFELKFHEYKVKMLRKHCSITGRVFEGDAKKVLWIKDKTLPITKENCFVTTKELSIALDRFTADTKFTVKELKKVMRVLS